MFKAIFIALVSFLTVGSIVSAAGFGQPSWAYEPIPLVAGQEYKTGSPLSGPGLFGLVGSILGMTSGGGSVIWTGQEFAPVGTASHVPNSVTINGVQMQTFTHDEAQQLQDGVDWSTVENKQRVTTPGAIERANCAYSFKAASLLAAGGIDSYDWCEGKEIDHASAGNCPSGQRLWVTMVEDRELGARIVYSCR